MLLSVVAVSAKDIKTVILTTTPQMKCEKCENHIREALRFVKGVKDIQPSAEKQKVVIVYDADKTSLEKLQKQLEQAEKQKEEGDQMQLEKIGYKTRVTTADEVIAPGEQTNCETM